jgi:predicted membrane chloride channel (bestrophin family)
MCPALTRMHHMRVRAGHMHGAMREWQSCLAGKVAMPDACSVLQVLLCLQVISHIIENSGISEFQKLQMQENITTFEDILGGCERLLRTPIPVSYTRHTSRFLIIWLTVLPYALWAKLAWATIPAVGLISLLLLGMTSSACHMPAPCCVHLPAGVSCSHFLRTHLCSHALTV